MINFVTFATEGSKLFTNSVGIYGIICDMGVSKNSFFLPQIMNFNRVFHYKPIHFGGPPLFLETPILMGYEL